MKSAGWILWPSCLSALAAEAVFFAIFDPVDLSLLWNPLGPSRSVAYFQGFLLFWIFTAASSGLTLFLQRASGDKGEGYSQKGSERSFDRSTNQMNDFPERP